MAFKTWIAGEVAKAADFNENYNLLFKLHNEKAINDVTATASGVLAGSSQKMIDKFLDSTGQNNTIDTGNTTSIFSTSKLSYQCNGPLSSIVSEPSFETVTNWTYSETDTDFDGGQTTDNPTIGTYSYRLGSTNSNTKTGGTYCQILQSVDFTNINELVFDSYFTFASNNYTRFQIYIGAVKVYELTLDDIPTGTETWYLNNILNVSGYTGTQNLIFRMFTYNNASCAYNVYLDNIRTSYQDSTIQSAAVTVSASKTKVFITPLMYEVLATGDSITADVSIDGGSTYTTGLAVNQWNSITSTTGTSLIVKANLNTNDGTTTPKVIGWCVLLE